MEEITDNDNDVIKKIKENVEQSRQYMLANNTRFDKYRSFIFESTVSRDDRSTLIAAEKPVVEVNVLESYLSRLWGEWSKQIPDLSVRAQNDKVNPRMIDVIEGILRSILSGSGYENKANQVYRDTMSGGFSAWKVFTEYENQKSMKQVIRFNKCYDPTLTGFDPLAREPSKCDGQFCFELIPKYKKELEIEYPNIDFSKIKSSSFIDDGQFRWTYKQDKKDIFYVADYYEKIYKMVTMYEISDNDNPDETHTVTKDEYNRLIGKGKYAKDGILIDIVPEILSQAEMKTTVIMRHKFIGDVQIEKPEETDFEDLPIVFVDGNSVIIRGHQMTRPYAFNAMDSQRIKNLAASNIVNDLENTRQTDVLIAKDALPQEQEFVEGWLNPQKTKAALVYESVGDDGQQLPPPQIFPRSQVNAAFIQIFELQDKTIQAILGSYDAQLGIQDNQLSGVAIVEGATQSNNTAMPYVISYLSALNQVAKIIMNLLPKYYNTLRTIPIVLPNGKHAYQKINDSRESEPIMIDYDCSDLDVVVVAGANFDVQRNKALVTMTELMKVSETFRAMIETKGLPLLLDNIDIRGKDQLKDMAEEFMAEQKQKSEQKQDPQLQMMQAEIQLKQQALQMQGQKQQGDLMIEAEKLKQDKTRLMQEQMRLMSEIDEAKATIYLRMTEAKNEADRTQAQLLMDRFDQQLKTIQVAIKSHSGT